MNRPNRRILLVDDSPSIHDDFRKILGGRASQVETRSSARAAFFGQSAPAPEPTAAAEGEAQEASFELVSALQGQEALEKLLQARSEGNPFAMAFVDVRMPPGWDGIRTIAELWKEDPDLQVVICTAYSDYSWSETLERLPHTDRLLILKKPFDSVEIYQLAHALTEKWSVARHERELIDSLKLAEQEARAYASSLETVNRALESSKASAEGSARTMGEFLVRLSSELQGGLTSVLQPIVEGVSLDQSCPLALEGSLTTAMRLLGSLDELHDLCLLETGRIKNDPAPCSPVEIARSVVSELASLAEAHSVSLRTEFDGPLPGSMLVDGQRLGQVLRQLVRNGIEHGRAESVVLRASTAQTTDWKRPEVRFEVTDDGVGIPVEHQASIFAPFVRLEDGPSRSGTGIGLTLARRLANMIGGDLTVHSSGQGGSTFRLQVPVGNVHDLRMVEAP